MSRRRRTPASRRPVPRVPLREPTTVLRGRAEEFAAALPELLGYPPVESLVLVYLGGDGRRPRQRSLTLRLDLLPVEHDREVARAVGAPLQAFGEPPWGALVFVVTEDADDAVARIQADPWRITLPRPDAVHRPTVPDLPRRALAHAVAEELAAWGVQTVDAVLVRAGRWWSYPDVDRLTGAGLGEPLDPAGSRLAGIAAMTGTVVGADREAVVARAWPTTPATGEMRAACHRADDEVGGLADGDPALIVETLWSVVRDGVAAYAPGSRSGLPDAELARVGTALQLVPVRDRALALASGEDDDLLAAAEALWADLNARLPTDLAAVPALLLGYAAWLRGDGVFAVAAVERALTCDPGLSMARLLLQALRGAVAPAVLRAMMLDPEDGGRAVA